MRNKLVVGFSVIQIYISVHNISSLNEILFALNMQDRNKLDISFSIIWIYISIHNIVSSKNWLWASLWLKFIFLFIILHPRMKYYLPWTFKEEINRLWASLCFKFIFLISESHIVSIRVAMNLFVDTSKIQFRSGCTCCSRGIQV
jgi:hypothetical protein